MSLLLVSLYEFKQFLQIVLWIALPLTVIAVGTTVYLHYRRRKKSATEVPPITLDLSVMQLALATGVTPTGPESDQVLPDWLASSDPANISLLKRYEAEVRRYKEDYAALKDDYKELEFKYEDLRNKAYNGQPVSAPAELSGDLASLREEHEKLQLKLAAAEEEISYLKAKLNEGAYLQDLAEEKKLQVEFLQQQLDQRIKNFHELEMKAEEAAVHLREMKERSDSFEERIAGLCEELNSKQQELTGISEELNEWRATAQLNGQERQVKQEQLEEKTLLVNQLETGLRLMQEELETVRAEISSRQGLMDELKQDLVKEQQKARELENKLELSSNLLVRIYSELARSLNTGWIQWQHGQEPAPLSIQAAEKAGLE